MRRFAVNTLTVAGAVLVFVALCEVVLRFLPVDGGLVAEPVNADAPYFHFRPNMDLIWSRGADFHMVNRIRVNNAGAVNDQDYVADDDRPMVAVVGDSFIEAAMVPYAQTVHGRLAASLPDRVYSFGASGAPLSQYVAWATHARRDWGADRLVIAVIGNDFDESLLRYKTAPGFHYYQVEDDRLELVRLDYRPNPVRNVLLASALARYLLFNVQIVPRLQRLMAAWAPPAQAAQPEYAGNTRASVEDERVALSRRAVDAFLRDLQTVAGWDSQDVIFVMDGFRYPDRVAAQQGTYFDVMRRYFAEQASSSGFAVIDTDDLFFPDFRAAGQPFEFPQDGHWNGRAHGLIAAALMERLQR